MDEPGGTTIHRARWVLPIEGPPIAEGEVAVAGGVITQVGRNLAGTYTVEHDAILLPGLVNAHVHLQYGPHFADLAQAGLPFPAWLRALNGRRRQLDDEAWLEQAKTSVAQAIAAGTTAVADIVTNTIAAQARPPLRGICFLESVGIDDARWAGAERSRISAELARHPGAGLSPHTPYTVGTRVFQAITELARSNNMRLHPHLAESPAETEFIATGTGPVHDLLAAHHLSMELDGRGCGLTPTGYLESIGALGPDVHVAHGVHVDAADRNTLRRKGTAVALCARSNRILHAGAAPVAAYRAEGNPVAVGTDGLSSTPDLDLLGELRALRELALAQGSDPGGLDAWLLHAATSGGAYALGLAGRIGVLRAGAYADFALVEGDPTADPHTAVVHGRAVATYLAGEKVHG